MEKKINQAGVRIKITVRIKKSGSAQITAGFVKQLTMTALLIENENNSKQMFSQKLEIISSISTSCVIKIIAIILCFCKTESSSQVDLLVPESKSLIRKQLCASACSLRKFGEAVDSPLLLTKIVRIRCKTLIVFNGRDLLLSQTCFIFKR